MSRTKWILTLIGVVVVLLIIWRVFAGGSKAGAGSFGDMGDNAPVPVTVVAATTKNVPVYLVNSGTVQPINSVNVQPQVSGELLSIDYTEGQPVTKGQLLAQIDPRSLQAQLDQAQAKRAQDVAQLATAKANLATSTNPKYAPYVAHIDLVTQKNTVGQWQAAVAADDASIQNTRVQLGFTRITSPIDGVAGIRQVNPGNVVSTGTTLVTVTQMHPIDVVFHLAGQYLDEVRAAQAKASLNVAVLDADGKVVEDDGSLKVLDNQIDPQTSQFALKAEFPNANNLLFPGQYVPVRVKVSVDADALVVPAAAVQRGPDGEYVWLVTDTPPAGAAPASSAGNGKHRKGRSSAATGDAAKGPAHYVTMQTITTGGEATDNGTIVLKGLKPGDQVVTAGQFRLKQGGRVTPMRPGEVPPPPTSAEIKAAATKAGGGHGGRH